MADNKQLESLVAKVSQDLAGAFSAVLVRIGEQTGLFTALAQGSADSVELARRTGTAERYVREWLCAMAAAGYITYDPNTKNFSLSEEQRAVFAEAGTPVYLPPITDMLVAVYHDEPKITAAFKSGEGIPWSDHHTCLFCGMERFSKPLAAIALIEQWLPAMEGVETKLTHGAKVADIGCGSGGAIIAMAKRFPSSVFTGFDVHLPSIESASDQAQAMGLTNAHFKVATAQDFPGRDYDFVTIIDALHDMGDPVGAARRVHQALKADGAWMVVEPLAADNLEDNFTIQGQMAYAASTCICTPAALSQEGGYSLGAQAGEARLTAVLREGGFSRVRRVAEQARNIVLDVRP